MDEKVYGYMDWPRIEAIVYGDEYWILPTLSGLVTADG